MSDKPLHEWTDKELQGAVKYVGINTFRWTRPQLKGFDALSEQVYRRDERIAELEAANERLREGLRELKLRATDSALGVSENGSCAIFSVTLKNLDWMRVEEFNTRIDALLDKEGKMDD